MSASVPRSGPWRSEEIGALKSVAWVCAEGWVARLDTRLGFEAFDDHLLPLQQLDAMPVLLANFGGRQAEQPLKTVAQVQAYLRRIAQLPAWTDQAIVNMRAGMRRGHLRCGKLPATDAASTLKLFRT